MNKCKCCNDDKNIRGFYINKKCLIWDEEQGLLLSAWVAEKKLYASYEKDGEIVLADVMQIQFCPMCGREL